ncbi:MAG: cysteine synthase A [Acidobacteriota bacterium]
MQTATDLSTLAADGDAAAASAPRIASALDLIGNTPLMELRRVDPPEDRAAVFAKLEFRNPGGSVKDRLGLGLIRAGEMSGQLKPGGTIIEPTAGNTGIGLALVGCQRGYRVILCVPAHFSVEKQKLMEALGGTVVRTPSEDGMKGAIARAHELSGEIEDAYVPQQFENDGNPGIHYATTAPELWAQMDGRIDAAVVGVGSGGTFSGVARFLKDQDPSILCVAVEPNGSILQGGEPGKHEVEGIGASFIPGVLATDCMDEVIMVHDDDALDMALRVASSEGLLVGGSSGACAVAAFAIARRLGPGKRVVTVFPDGAERYISQGHLDAERRKTP